MLTIKTFCDKMRAQGFQLFRHRSDDYAVDARQNLKGRTFYAEPETHRFFKARIIYAGYDAGGLLYCLVESVPASPMENTRHHQFRVFDIFGTVVYPAPGEYSVDPTFKTAAKARENMRAIVARLDPVRLTMLGLESRMREIRREVVQIVAIQSDYLDAMPGDAEHVLPVAE